MENRAIWRIRFNPDPAAVGFDNRAGNRQSDTHAVTLCGDEWLKQLLSDFRSDTRAAVGDADPDVPVIDRYDGDDQIACLRSFHRIHCITNQIEKHLLDLYAIGKHEIDRRVELELRAYP